ncbi:LysR family transcriptional regulator [Reinekea blandensis]|uniref:Putative transcriptional regulator n=1 Tax=Reinekea blandensis MED297 TaxID=314283 RepID=A4BHT8_9GAMM|nr:LysR family transcriptional regulator [Reinekea blandensis]EAR08343.1 putative transcriptional regulator [Reinekea sp. MED297] [Reinekea blandensis MED297]
MNNTDWQQWHFFTVIARTGSLNQAADALGVSQPTLSRHLQSLEARLGQNLFDRSTRGLTLTAFGASLMEGCQQMEQTAQALERRASGQDQALSGRVRLSVNEMIAQYYLPNILPAFMDANPQLSVEIEVTNRASSLDKRDADIAVRMFPPTQLDLIARHLYDIPLGFYASQGYLDRFGTPTTPEALLEHRIMGYDRDKQFELGAAQLGWTVRNEDFFLRTDYMPLHIALAAQDGGIVGTHKELAESLGLIEIDVGVKLPDLPVYLCCHRDVVHNRRIRLLMDYLADSLPQTKPGFLMHPLPHDRS